MLHIEYEYDHDNRDGNEMPYADATRAIISLDLQYNVIHIFEINGEDYPIPSRIVNWDFPKTMTVYAINTMLKEIEPLVIKYIDESTKKDWKTYIITPCGEQIYSEIEDIIKSYENRQIEVEPISSEDFFVNYECPSYIFEFINNAEYYKSGKCIREDFEEAYDIRMKKFINDTKLSNLETATVTLQKILQSYVRDGYKNDFWQLFMPALNDELMYPEFKLMVHGHTIYYDYKKKIIINLN